MLTPLGYEEMRRLNQERLSRSLRRFQFLAALAERYESESEAPPCDVIDLPMPRAATERIGA